jgi:type IV secretory pathway VirB10-like protein
MDLTSTPTGIKLSSLPAAATARSRRGLYVGLGFAFAVGLLLLGGFLARFMGQTATEQVAQRQDIFTGTSDGESDSSQSGEGMLKELGLDGATPKAKQSTPTVPIANNQAGTPDPIQSPAGNAFDDWLSRSSQNSQGVPPPNGAVNQPTEVSRETPPLSTEEQIKLDAYNREYEALHKPLAGATKGASSAATNPSPTTSATVPSQPPTATRTDSDEVVTIKNPETKRPYIKTGTWIEARLDMTAVTDLPGDLHGRITADVIGQHNGESVKLIPMGAALIGSYSSRLSYGQDRLMQSWTTIVFSDGRKITLPEVSAADSTGAAGLKDKIDSHYSKLLRDAGLLTIFNVGVALTQRNQSLLTSPSIGNTIGQSVGSTMGELGSQLIGRNIALAPTGILRPGGEFRIQVKHDIIFAGKI